MRVLELYRHPVGGRLLMPPPYSNPTPGLSIGVVSYCNYADPSFPLPYYSRANKQLYVDRINEKFGQSHGSRYTLYYWENPFVKQMHAWANELLSVRHRLQQHDYVMWMTATPSS